MIARENGIFESRKLSLVARVVHHMAGDGNAIRIEMRDLRDHTDLTDGRIEQVRAFNQKVTFNGTEVIQQLNLQ